MFRVFEIKGCNIIIIIMMPDGCGTAPGNLVIPFYNIDAHSVKNIPGQKL